MRKLSYIWTLPWDLVVWLTAVIVALSTRGKLAWQDLGVWAVLPPRFGTNATCLGITLGHGGVLQDHSFGTKEDTTRTERHEGVHVEQYEAIALAGFVLGLIVFWTFFGLGHLTAGVLVGGLVWVGAFPAVIGAGHIVALVRGEPIYWGAVHEEAAYAITDDEE